MATDKTENSERKVPTISPVAIEIDWSGQCRKSVFVRLPKGIILDDFGNNPTIWSAIQGVPHLALRVHDLVYAVAYDESWAVECSVKGAGPVAVSLTKPKKIDLEGHTENFWEDELYLVKWAGSGFGVWRKKDNKQLATGFATGNSAKHEILKNIYPRAA